MKSSLPVLILEDSPEDIILIQNSFRELGVPNPLLTFSDRKSLWQYLHEIHQSARHQRHLLPGLIITDYYLHDSTALELIADIKSNEVFSHIPVIVFSGATDERDLAACYGAGCNGYFAKPSTVELYPKLMGVIYDFWRLSFPVPRQYATM